MAGASSFGAWLAIAQGQGWIRITGWSEHSTPKRMLLNSILMFGLGNAAIAWNEETIFRGTGFDLWAEAIGLGPAAVFLTGLFAVAHGPQLMVIVGEASLGAVLLLLRLNSGSIWLPIGYHWASNVMQSAIFGIPQAEPSLLPLIVEGPIAWTGRPGKAEPGWLFVLLNLVIASVLALRRWQTTKHTHMVM